MELKTSAITAKKVMELLTNGGQADPQRLESEITKLIGRIYDELRGRKFLVMSSAEEKYYDVEGTFLGQDILNTLSYVHRLSEEADEAGNCFALSRYTACVFHLMRVMEHCLQELATKFGKGLVVTYDQEWQKIINDIRGTVKLKYPKDKDPMRIKYEAMLGHLETVKITWRNSTMHPKATYTDREAEKIIGAVQAFVEDFVALP